VFNFDEFTSGGLHEKHALVTWNLGTSQQLLEDGGKPRKHVSRWPDTRLLLVISQETRI
jgi:hypothetical protein